MRRDKRGPVGRECGGDENGWLGRLRVWFAVAVLFSAPAAMDWLFGQADTFLGRFAFAVALASFLMIAFTTGHPDGEEGEEG